jgi:hypothetical protein
LGIASLEDKIVQQAVLWVIQFIYEQDFLGFTFDFLSFTHVVAKTRTHGRFTVHRYTISKRLRATLHKNQRYSA